MSNFQTQLENMILDQLPKELLIPKYEDKDIKSILLSVLSLVKENNERIKNMYVRVSRMESNISSMKVHNEYWGLNSRK